MGDTRTENREINYVNDPVGKLYRRLLPSAIGSLLTATVASLIDVVILSYFLGPSMLAVVELCMPVYMLVNTLATPIFWVKGTGKRRSAGSLPLQSICSSAAAC